MKKKYRVLFLGLTGNKEAFKSRMVHLGAPSESVSKMIGKAPVILKEGLGLEFSLRYANAVERAGGIVEVQEYGEIGEPMGHTISIASFKDFTRCPECGLKQQKRETCVKCGFKLLKIEDGLGSKNVSGN